MDNNKDNVFITPCVCSSEVLYIQRDEDVCMDNDVEYDIGIFSHYNVSGLSWKDKLRYCWEILKKGRPYGDQMILYESQMVELKEYLNKMIPENEGAKNE